MTAETAPRRVHLTGTCEAVYTAGAVELTAAEDEEVLVPIPAGAQVTGVVAVLNAGGEAAHRHAAGPDGVLVAIPASSGPVRCVRILMAR